MDESASSGTWILPRNNSHGHISQLFSLLQNIVYPRHSFLLQSHHMFAESFLAFSGTRATFVRFPECWNLDRSTHGVSSPFHWARHCLSFQNLPRTIAGFTSVSPEVNSSFRYTRIAQRFATWNLSIMPKVSFKGQQQLAQPKLFSFSILNGLIHNHSRPVFILLTSNFLATVRKADG